MNIITYLTIIGFKPVRQVDEIGSFIDPCYLCKDGLYAELHEDNTFYLWYDVENPIYEIILTDENWLEVHLRVTEILLRYYTPFQLLTEIDQVCN